MLIRDHVQDYEHNNKGEEPRHASNDECVLSIVTTGAHDLAINPCGYTQTRKNAY